MNDSILASPNHVFVGAFAWLVPSVHKCLQDLQSMFKSWDISIDILKLRWSYRSFKRFSIVALLLHYSTSFLSMKLVLAQIGRLRCEIFVASAISMTSRQVWSQEACTYTYCFKRNLAHRSTQLSCQHRGNVIKAGDIIFLIIRNLTCLEANGSNDSQPILCVFHKSSSDYSWLHAH